MSNQMTIYDISKKAGVSIATVSRVLNGSANVKPKTRKKVMDIIEQYGYKPNAFARGLGLNSMKLQLLQRSSREALGGSTIPS